MQWDILFFFNSVLLGVGLAMDAFSVSLANGLNEPRMSRAADAGHCRGVCRLPGPDAHDGVDLRPHHRAVFPGL